MRYRLAGQIDSTDHFADAVDWAIGTFAGYDPTPSTVTLRFGCEGLLDIAEKIYPELPPRKPALKPAVKRLAKRRAQKRRSS